MATTKKTKATARKAVATGSAGPKKAAAGSAKAVAKLPNGKRGEAPTTSTAPKAARAGMTAHAAKGEKPVPAQKAGEVGRAARTGRAVPAASKGGANTPVKASAKVAIATMGAGRSPRKAVVQSTLAPAAVTPVVGGRSPRGKRDAVTPAMAHAVGGPLGGTLDLDGSLAQLLLRAALHPELGMSFVQADTSELRYSYAELLGLASRRLVGLRECGLQRGQAVPLVISSGFDFVVTFWACMLGGIVAVPLAYPSSFTAVNNALSKVHEVWGQLGRPPILGDHTMQARLSAADIALDADDARSMQVLVVETIGVDAIDVEAVDGHADAVTYSPTTGDALAFIQYSSGSTGKPKGVALTHRNLLTNVEAIMMATGHRPGETVLSWMPFSHDMGLIGLHLFPMAGLASQVNIPPHTFVRRPLLWLEKIAEHRAVMTGSPNFGYRLVLDKLAQLQARAQRLDLSCLRVIFNGAEPIAVPTMREFMQALKPSGLRPEAMFPVYGMAESSVATTFPPVGSLPLVRAVDRRLLAEQGVLRLVDESDGGAMLIVDEGCPVPGCEVRVVDDRGALLAEGMVGHVQIRGGNVTAGYLDNPQANAETFDGDWLRTGDLGFMVDGRLSITGRHKDIVIVDGQKFFAYDIESCAEQVEGVVGGRVVACGWHDAELGRERVVVFAAVRTGDGHEGARLALAQVCRAISARFGIGLDAVVQIKSVPRTTSGKLQRYQLRAAFQQGEFADSTYTAPDLLGDHDDDGVASAQAPAQAPAQPPTQAPDLDRLRQQVRRVWAQVLGRDEARIPLRQPFLALGGTSVKAVQVLGEIEQALGTVLSHEFLLQCRTVEEMAVYLRAHLGQAGHDAIGVTRIGDGAAPADEDIAIIGMACRFPHADTPEAFWDNLARGRDCIGEVPGDRWNTDRYFQPGAPAPGKTNSRWGGFLDEPCAFDAGLFGIAAEEATIMDPQQRLFLQGSWEALERAGYSGAGSDGRRVGVFVGASHNNYMEHHLHGIDLLRLQQFDTVNAMPDVQRQALLDEWRLRFGDNPLHPNTAVDNLLNMIAARTSQLLNLKGPSLAIDTACSSSLVAIHLACDALRRGECEMALAGGVNLNLSPTPYLLFARAGALSPTGRCKVFDAGADGFVPGEGMGVVVLKPLSKALADGDQVLAVVKRSFVNNDGRSLGPMAPNPDGQRVAIASVYRDGTLKTTDVQYVEAHGTGTSIGDPSEMRALAHVFGEHGSAPGSCVVGSVKANIGHLLAAAGVASVIKLVLALQHRQMPPSLHVYQPNPQIDFPATPFRLLGEIHGWAAPAQGARRGAVNSFGFGGTNCHMVIEEGPPLVAVAPVEPAPRPAHLLCLSARSADALQRRVDDLAVYLERHPQLSAVDVCHTQHAGRRHFAHRTSVVADSVAGLAEKLRAVGPGSVVEGSAPARLALMFTGQGSQYPGMGRRLYESLPAFARIVDECAEAFAPHLSTPLLDSLYDAGSDAQVLARTDVTQPVVFTIDYALGRLLLEYGVRPDCVLGHSVGEYAAACLAGVMSLADAATVVAARGRLMAALPAGGGMMAVFEPREALAPRLTGFDGRLWFGAHNGNHQVVSGELAAIAQLQETLQALGTVCKPLQVSHAFHTPLLEPMLGEFARVLAQVEFHPPRLPLVSNLGGQWVSDAVLDADYWCRHVLEPVAFEQSVQLAAEQGISVFVECGPDKVLSNLSRAILTGRTVDILPVLDRRRDDWETLLSALGGLYRAGVALDWDALDAGLMPRRVPMPGYPFARDRYRIATSDAPIEVPAWGAVREALPASATAAGAAMAAAPRAPAARANPMAMAPAPTRLAQPAHRDWPQVVRQLVAEFIRVPAESIDMYRPFVDLGLDSAAAVALAERLGAMVDQRFPSTLLFEYQSPAALVDLLRDQMKLPEPGVPSATAMSSPAAAVSAPSTALAPRHGSMEPLESDEANLRDHDVAIIGMACRLPGADTPEAFWQMLVEGRTAVREVRADQWSLDDYFDPDNRRAHTSYSKWGAFLDRPYDFDPLFFGISPREAEAMDPQQRLFLQVAWEALQQSGYGGEFRTREIGVFVGCEQNHYGEHFIIHQRYQALCQRFGQMPWFAELPPERRLELLTTLRDVMEPAELISDAVAGQGLNEIAARVSHWLDLRGPNLIVNTACSSSMVALHLACESLRSGESRIAIAGAAYLTGNDSPFVFLSRVGALSPNGQCAPFDEKANGMVLGEGVSALVLKPLKDAVRDGDFIHAVIKGSSINNDGHSNGITAPNPRGQADALRKAYVNAGLTPEAISYIECHGTGTPLGDPVELDGMTQAFRKFTDRTGFCAIGSIKSSVGHMLSGSSLPSLMKVAMSLQQRMIPPTAGYSRANPHIDFAQSPFHVVSGRPMSWLPSGDAPLRAGVNSFGFGGTNCHVVLEEAPRLAPSTDDRAAQLLTLSGRTQAVLQSVAAMLRDHLQRHPQITAAQACLSSNGSQRDLAFKAALRVGDRHDLLAKLDALASGSEAADVLVRRSNPKQSPQLVLVLDGVCPLDADGIDELIASFPQLQQICDDCKTHYAQATVHANTLKQQHLDDLLYAFAVQYALGSLLMATELRPTAIVAEGTGVLAGACLLGMLDLRQAAQLLSRYVQGRHDLPDDDGAAGERTEGWNCPLTIPGSVLVGGHDQAQVRLGGYLQQPRRLAASDVRELLRDDAVFVHLGGGHDLPGQLGLPAGTHWLDLHEGGGALARVLGLFGRLYVHGARFNARPLAAQGTRRVPLPTYPFENRPYRFKRMAVPGEAVEASTSASASPAPTPAGALAAIAPVPQAASRLVPVSAHAAQTLEPAQRQAISRALLSELTDALDS